MTWPLKATTSMFKPPRAKERARRVEISRDAVRHENLEKRKVRARDKFCRFPLCGCRAIHMPAHVSHDVHKGIGGDPSGERSLAAGMIFLCAHRHLQLGVISRHAGTLRTEYLTDQGNNGPVSWQVLRETLMANFDYLLPRRVIAGVEPWVEIARESAVQQLHALDPWQRDLLTVLAKMDW